MLVETKQKRTMKLGRSSKKELKKLIAVDLQRKKFEFPIPFSDELKVNGKKGEVTIKQDDKHGTYLLWKNKTFSRG